MVSFSVREEELIVSFSALARVIIDVYVCRSPHNNQPIIDFILAEMSPLTVDPDVGPPVWLLRHQIH